MRLRVVGAGLGRTGTTSLKAALERLLGGRCYHMTELFGHAEHIPVWQRAARGLSVDWDEVLDGYVAAVDWPAAAFWPELSLANPDAVVVLSTRDSPETWWRSARGTIFASLVEPPAAWKAKRPESAPWRDMWEDLVAHTFTADYLDPAAAMAAYERHNSAVLAGADPARLVDWQPGDGWGPLCTALSLPVPDEPFPRLNTSEEWAAGRS